MSVAVANEVSVVIRFSSPSAEAGEQVVRSRKERPSDSASRITTAPRVGAAALDEAQVALRGVGGRQLALADPADVAPAPEFPADATPLGCVAAPP